MALELSRNKSELYPMTIQKIKELDRIISDKIMAWRMFCARWELDITNYYGKQIHYKSVKYEGSPELVFWGNFIEPFLENGIIDILNSTYQLCAEKNLTPDTYMNEACNILKLLNRNTYENMRSTDQVLRCNGHPDSVAPKNVYDKIKTMNQFVDSHLIALLKTRKAKDTITEDVIDLRPNFCGIGLNLNALWRKTKKYIIQR